MHAVILRMIDLIERQRKAGPVDLQDVCVRMTMDMIGTVAWDANFGALDGSTGIYDTFQTAFDVGLQLRIDPRTQLRHRIFSRSKQARLYKKAIKDMAAEWHRLLNAAKEREDPAEGEEPLWCLPKKTVDPETKAPLRDKDLVTELSTMMVAGMPTTGHQLTWILAFLFANGGALEKLANELAEHKLSASQTEGISLKVLEEMPYLNAVIKEGRDAGGSRHPREHSTRRDGGHDGRGIPHSERDDAVRSGQPMGGSGGGLERPWGLQTGEVADGRGRFEEALLPLLARREGLRRTEPGQVRDASGDRPPSDAIPIRTEEAAGGTDADDQDEAQHAGRRRRLGGRRPEAALSLSGIPPLLSGVLIQTLFAVFGSGALCVSRQCVGQCL